MEVKTTKFQIGDRVQVSKRLSVGDTLDGITMIKPMKRLFGRIATVTDVKCDGGTEYYRLNGWYWWPGTVLKKWVYIPLRKDLR